MCFNPSLVRRVPSPNRYMAVARFCFCKNNKRTIDRPSLRYTRGLGWRMHCGAEVTESVPINNIIFFGRRRMHELSRRQVLDCRGRQQRNNLSGVSGKLLLSTCKFQYLRVPVQRQLHRFDVHGLCHRYLQNRHGRRRMHELSRRQVLDCRGRQQRNNLSGVYWARTLRDTVG